MRSSAGRGSSFTQGQNREKKNVRRPRTRSLEFVRGRGELSSTTETRANSGTEVDLSEQTTVCQGLLILTGGVPNLGKGGEVLPAGGEVFCGEPVSVRSTMTPASRSRKTQESRL